MELNISLAHVHTYMHPPHVHPHVHPHTYTPHSAGWLYIIDQWLSLSGAIKHDLMMIAAATPDLLPSCLSLLHSEETLG